MTAVEEANLYCREAVLLPLGEEQHVLVVQVEDLRLKPVYDCAVEQVEAQQDGEAILLHKRNGSGRRHRQLG